jgi:hypothetical protein
MMDFRYETQPDHLLVKVTGAFDSPTARTATEKMVSICRAESLQRVMVDARGLSEVLSIADRFDLVSFMTAQRAPIRIAVLVSNTQAGINASQRTVPIDPSSPLLTTASPEEAVTWLGLKKDDVAAAP